MRLSVTNFATLVSWLSVVSSRQFVSYEVSDLAEMVKACDESSSQVNPPPAPVDMVDELLRAMRNGEKISAIKAYRTLTGYGLKESKDVIERYLVERTSAN